MRKEYNDRWNAPIVNPGFTWGEYQNRKSCLQISGANQECTCTAKVFVDMGSADAHFTRHQSYCPLSYNRIRK